MFATLKFYLINMKTCYKPYLWLLPSFVRHFEQDHKSSHTNHSKAYATKAKCVNLLNLFYNYLIYFL